MKWFKKLFIKDYASTGKPEVRTRYGIAAGVFGICSNAVICALKLVVGIIGGSVTVIADAVNNLSDAGSSAVTVAGFKLASRPADREHPYGHWRAEYVATMCIAFLVLVLAVELAVPAAPAEGAHAASEKVSGGTVTVSVQSAARA